MKTSSRSRALTQAPTVPMPSANWCPTRRWTSAPCFFTSRQSMLSFCSSKLFTRLTDAAHSCQLTGVRSREGPGQVLGRGGQCFVGPAPAVLSFIPARGSALRLESPDVSPRCSPRGSAASEATLGGLVNSPQLLHGHLWAWASAIFIFISFSSESDPDVRVLHWVLERKKKMIIK